ncbi:hypothetical protein [uncultured Nostoc sp.]
MDSLWLPKSGTLSARVDRQPMVTKKLVDFLNTHNDQRLQLMAND